MSPPSFFITHYCCPTNLCRRMFLVAPFCTLSPRHRIIAEGGIPPVQYEFEREKWAMGERFGHYGLRAGVDIRKLWPTVEEVEEVKALRMFRTANEAKHIAETNARKEQIRRQNRLDRIQRNWESYDAQLAEFNQREVREQAETKTADQELKRKVEEVRNFFGYWVDPKDPRFSIMLRHRENSLKLAAKMAVKKKKKYGQVKTVSTADQTVMKLVQDELRRKLRRSDSGAKGEEEEKETVATPEREAD